MALYFLQSCNNFCIYISLFTLKKWYGFVPNSNVTIKGLVCFSGRCVMAYFVTRKPDYTNRTYFHYPTFRIGCRITTKIKYLSMFVNWSKDCMYSFSVFEKKNWEIASMWKSSNWEIANMWKSSAGYELSWSGDQILLSPKVFIVYCFIYQAWSNIFFFLFVGNGTQHSNGITLLYFLEEECKGNKRSS